MNIDEIDKACKTNVILQRNISEKLKCVEIGYIIQEGTTVRTFAYSLLFRLNKVHS